MTVSLFLLLASAIPGNAQNAASLLHFYYNITTDAEDKDADTNVDVFLICNNMEVGSALGVGYGRRFPPMKDKKPQALVPGGSLQIIPDASGELVLTGTVPSRQELAQCVVKITEQANGNDHWSFIVNFPADFQDGSNNLMTGDGRGDLNSTGSNEVAQFFPLHPGH